MQQEDNKEKFLKYGDHIILQTNEPPYLFLSGRSSHEEYVFMLKNNQDEESSYIEYPNYQEMLFLIYPKLHYKETKRYQKARKELIIDESMEELYQRRLKAEEDLNEKQVQDLIGTQVKIGDEVQIMHVFSKSFLKATTEKNTKANDIFYMKLSKIPSSGTHFSIKINPYMNFKKSGEKIAYEDSFYFDNPKYKSNICTSNLPQYIQVEDLNQDQIDTKNYPVAIQKKYPLELPCVLENLKQYTVFEAGHKKEQIASSIFKARQITCHKNQIPRPGIKPLRYGQFVRLQHITKNRKTGTVTSEFNICGLSPQVRLVTEKDTSDSKINHQTYTSIFQILPSDESLMGQIIEYDQGNQNSQFFSTMTQQSFKDKLNNAQQFGKIDIKLRHVMTGRYLLFDELQTKGAVYLSEQYDQFITEQKEKQEKERLKKQEKKGFFAKKEKEEEDKKNINLDENLNPNNNPNKEKNVNFTTQANNYSPEEEFQKRVEITIESTSHEDQVLQINSMFSLKLDSERDQQKQTDKGRFLKVDDSDDTFNIDNTFLMKENIMELDFMQQWTKQPVYASMNPMGYENYQLGLQDNLGDYFFFTHVNNQDLNDIQTIQSLIYPLTQLNFNLESEDNAYNFSICEQVLQKISLWLCQVDLENKNSAFLQLPSTRLQYLVREIGVIDILVKISSDMLELKYFSDDNENIDEYSFNFTKALLEFLSLITDLNKPNSFYIFQWYSLFKQIILTKIKKDFRFDTLVNSWLDQLEIQNSFKSDLTEIASEIKFSEMNINALNLLTAFVSYNEYREKADQEDIVFELMKNDQRRNNIFRKLVINQEQNQLMINVVDNDSSEDFPLQDTKFQKKTEYQEEQLQLKSQCTVAIINMMIELCKGGPQYVIEYMSELYPIGYCKKIFIDDNVEYQFRSLFISLFMESYMNMDLRYCQSIDLPNIICLSKGIRPISKSYYNMMQAEKTFLTKYENKSFNLKIIIKEYFTSLEDNLVKEYVIAQKQNSNFKGNFLRKHNINLLSKSMLQMCLLLLRKGFYYIDECVQLKDNLMQILEISLNLYNYIEEGNETKKVQHDKVKKSAPQQLCNNICQIIDCLEVIETIVMNYKLVKFNHCIEDLQKKQNNQQQNKNNGNIMSGKKMEKEQFIQQLMRFISDNIVITDTDHQQVIMLHEWMLLEHQQLNCKIMDYILIKFSQKKNFIEASSQALLIDEFNLSFYNEFLTLYYNIHFGVVDLKYASESEGLQKEYDIYKNLKSYIIELNNILFVNDKVKDQKMQDYKKKKYQYETGQQFVDMLQQKKKSNAGTVLGKLTGKLMINTRKTPVKNDKKQKQLEKQKQKDKDKEAQNKLIIKEQEQGSSGSKQNQSDLESFRNKLGPQTLNKSDKMFGVANKKDLPDDLPLEEQSDLYLSSKNQINSQHEIVQDNGNLQREKKDNYENQNSQEDEEENENVEDEDEHCQKIKQIQVLEQRSGKTQQLENQNGNNQQYQQIDNQNCKEVDQPPKKVTKFTENIAKTQIKKNNANIQEDNELPPDLALFKPNFYHVYEDYNIQLDNLQQLQSFMKAMDFQKQLIYLLQLASPNNIKIWKDEESKKIKQKTIESCICALIYFVLHNPKNQLLIIENQQFRDVLTTLLWDKDDKILKLIYILLNELYTENLELILNFNNQHTMDILNRIMKKNHDYLKNLYDDFQDKQIQKTQSLKKLKTQARKSTDNTNYYKVQNLNFVYFLDFLTTLFQIKEKSLQQNQENIRELIEKQIGNLLRVSITRNLGQQIIEMELPFKSMENNAMYLDEQIEIPGEMIVFMQFLKTFRMLLSQGSTESINFARSFMPLTDLRKMLDTNHTNNFWPLKLEIMNFITDIYLSGKQIEDNEYQIIQSIFKEILIPQLEQFCNNISQRQVLQKSEFYNKDFLNIFRKYNIYSSQKYIVEINFFKAWEQYIIFGIFKAFLFYQQKVPELISDLDLSIQREVYQFCNNSLSDFFQNPNRVKQEQKPQEMDIKPKKIQRKSVMAPTVINPKSFNKLEGSNHEVNDLETTKNTDSKFKDVVINKVIQIMNLSYIKEELVESFMRDEEYLDIQEAFRQISKTNIQNYQQDEKQLEYEHSRELGTLTQLLLTVKLQDPEKFKQYLQQYINVLSTNNSSDPLQSSASKSSMKILRKISNYKQNMEIAESIQQDLCSLGFLKYLCEVIVNQENMSQKLEYIIGMVDFLDEANQDIQENLYIYLLEDEQNMFICTLKNILDQNFKQFKEYEKNKTHLMQLNITKREANSYIKQNTNLNLDGNDSNKSKNDNNNINKNQLGKTFTKTIGFYGSMNSNHQKTEYIMQNVSHLQNFILQILHDGFNSKAEKKFIAQEFNKVIHMRLEVCKQVLELIRLSCENHYSKMQHYLRIQVTETNILKRNQVNMLNSIAELFSKYTKIVSGETIDFGIKILDTLIELIQGPCKENQVSIVSSKILENLEDIMFQLHKQQQIQSEKQGISSSLTRSQSLKRTNTIALTEDKEGINKFKNAKRSSISKFHYKMLLFLSSLFEGNTDPFLLNKIQLFINVNLLLELIDQTYTEYAQFKELVNKQHYALYYCLQQKQEINKLENEIMNCKVLEQKAENEEDDEDDEEQELQQFGSIGNDIIYYQRGELAIYEGYSCYNLIQNLVTVSSQFEKKYLEEKKEFVSQRQSGQNFLSSFKEYKPFQFFRENCISIEIINSQKQIQKVFFRKPPLTNYLSQTTKTRFLENVSRDSSVDKIQGLLESYLIFENEMNHILYLCSRLGSKINLSYLTWFRNTNLFLIFVQNLFILVITGDKDLEEESSIKSIKLALGWIQLVSAIGIFVLFGILELPVDYKRVVRQKRDSIAKQIAQDRGEFILQVEVVLHLIFKTHTFYLLINIIISILGLFINQLFYSLLMLDIIDRFPELGNVLLAITVNKTQLLMTALLGAVILYIYAIIGVSIDLLQENFTYADDESINPCETALGCFEFIFNIGLRQGGGIGDIITLPKPSGDTESLYHYRTIYDLSFFVIMIIIWMNVVFGIIIDTFAELRDDKKQRDKDQKNNCFICNLTRQDFENENISFENHLNYDHHIWNYVYYIQHLNQKDQNDYDGIESYVFDKIQSNDISWFPIGRSLSMDETEDDDDQEIIMKQLTSMTETLSKVQTKLNQIQ